MKQFIVRSTLALAAFVGCSGMAAKPVSQVSLNPALLVLEEHRFNPAVQRMLAREELKALPISQLGIFLVIPVHQDPLLEEMQIRYLEKLLEKLETDEPSSE